MIFYQSLIWMYLIKLAYLRQLSLITANPQWMIFRIGYKAKNHTSCFICFLKEIKKKYSQKPVPTLS